MANVQRLDTTVFSCSADTLEEAVEFAISHLQELVEERKLGGFVAPELDRQSFELRDGKWTRVYRFTAELLPAVVA